MVRKEKKSSEWQLCGQKCFVDVRGEWADWLEMIRKAKVTQITTRYNQGMQNTISWTHNTSNPEADGGYSSRKTTPGAAPVSYEQKTEAIIRTGSPKLDNRRLEKRLPGLIVLISAPTFRW